MNNEKPTGLPETKVRIPMPPVNPPMASGDRAEEAANALMILLSGRLCDSKVAIVSALREYAAAERERADEAVRINAILRTEVECQFKRAEQAEGIYQEAVCAENALVAIIQEYEKEAQFLRGSIARHKLENAITKEILAGRYDPTPSDTDYETPLTAEIQRLKDECDGLRKQVKMDTIRFKEMQASGEKLEAQQEQLVGLLACAKCPDPNCDGHGASWYVSQSRSGEPE